MTEQEIIDGLKQMKIEALKELISVYAEDMTVLASLLLHDQAKATVMVDNLLLDLWNGKDFENLTPPLHIYLMTIVRNACGYD